MAENYEYKRWRNFPMKEWRWKNFTPKEMACRGDGRLMINYDAMDKLQALRDLIAKPMTVNSAYRTKEYNATLQGSAKNSMHLQARAFDISMNNQNPAEFENAARAVGFRGFGFYPKSNFIHIDTGRARTWGSRWFSATPVIGDVHMPDPLPDMAQMADVRDAIKPAPKVNPVIAGGAVALVAAFGVWWDQITAWIGGLFG